MSFHGGFTGCVAAVVLFAKSRGIPVLSLGDVTCAVGPIGLFLGRLANFINGELWGRPADVPWAMVFPTGGPLPRHPSQLYEATLEGIVLFAVLALLIRGGALKRPGFIIGAFAIGYALRALVLRVVPRAGRAARLPVGRAHDGHAAVGPAVSRSASCCIVIALKRPPRTALHDMTPLEAEIRRIIAIDGPIPVDRYMELCLGHPRHGYYVTRDPFGARGDFITAPEVSQMFGELIGAWAAAVWQQMGSPERVQLIELGPGRGTLMADALRAAQALPQFHAALSVASGRDQPGIARSAGKDARECAMSDRVASRHRGDARTGRQSRSPTSSSMRCRSASSSRTATAGTIAHGRARGRQAGVRRGARSPCSATAPQPMRARAPARSWSGASRPAGLAAVAPHRAAWRRRAGHRLRPCRERVRRHVAGGARRTNLPIRLRRRAKPISPRMSTSPHSPAAAQRQGATRARTRRARRIPAPPRHRTRAPPN